jgi:putative membrane protein
VSTLVLCIYRGDDLDADPPVVGAEAVEDLVTTVGVDDPEDSRVNCLLEGLRVTRDLDDETVLAVLCGEGDTVTFNRAIAAQVDDLVETYSPDSAVAVVDSAEDERLVPIIESRIAVDAIDRVVVRQARDIESTYYLLKQFLADEELRKTVLVPLGLTLLAFPALLAVFDSITVSFGAIAAVVGLFLLYKGLNIDALLATLSTSIRDALYAGKVSLVTYVVAGGLALVGLFVGALGASSLDRATAGELVLSMQFLYDSIPWLTGAALIASAGRLLDEVIRDDDIGSAYINLPFVAVAVGLAVRGFAAYVIQRSDVSGPFVVPTMSYGPLEVEQFSVAPETLLAVFILSSIVVSLVGVRVAAYVNSVGYDNLEHRG